MKEVVNLDLILNDKVTDIEVREQKELLLVEGNCIECGDQPSIVHCEQCDDDYCQVCFAHQHRKGNRTSHTVVKKAANEEALSPNPALKIADTKEDLSISAQEFLEKLPVIHTKQDYIEKAKFIPLRLTFDERKFLKLLEAALSVSSYTDKIDILTYSSKTTRIIQQIKELLGILAGLVLAADYKAGQKLFEDKEFKDNAEFFQMVFELGRRHKIMNPEKMRDGYGKLIYMLQDSQIEQVSELLQFKCVKPIITVHSVLEEYGKLGLLQDELLILATQEIIDDGRKRKDIQYDIKRKEKAIEILSKKYSDRHIEAETIRQCLYSIGDNNAFLRVNRDPCIIMIGINY